jgi:hypothetical protein
MRDLPDLIVNQYGRPERKISRGNRVGGFQEIHDGTVDTLGDGKPQGKSDPNGYQRKS